MVSSLWAKLAIPFALVAVLASFIYLGSPGSTSAVNVPSLVEKPWVFSQEMATYGKHVYQTNCAVCHGKTGRGNGPASRGLVPPPRDLVKGKWTQGGTTKDLFVTVQKGISGTSMAGFAGLSQQELWAIVHFVRSITTNRPQDDLITLEGFASAHAE